MHVLNFVFKETLSYKIEIYKLLHNAKQTEVKLLTHGFNKNLLWKDNKLFEGYSVAALNDNHLQILGNK